MTETGCGLKVNRENSIAKIHARTGKLPNYVIEDELIA